MDIIRWGKRISLWAILSSLLAISPAYADTQSSARRVALSFDDIPRGEGAFMTMDDRTDKIIAALKGSGAAQVVFFLNPCKLSEAQGAGGEARIAAYVAAGHVIANHSCTHPQLSNSDTESYLADIDKAEAWLKGRPGYRPWFRFPYLDEGGADKVKRDAIRSGLAQRGLTNGYVTADGSDWNLEQLTLDARAAGKDMDMKALRKLYVASQMSALDYHDELAQLTLGRSPAHVLLLHETDLAALFLPDLIAEMKRRGWAIISADEAFADPINKAMPDVPFAAGTLTGSMAWERDIAPPLSPLWMTVGVQKYLFEKQVLKDAVTQ
ncbi:polysaccharide deacetylase family protein [Sphingorhabdus arenilitoris]|uniref:Chitooligosaccharide deacetylase n=1 Tax=Sphingorhabdus arenilitoris TaxID=1490041 RepID=A0ABV8RH12_9SPHN